MLLFVRPPHPQWATKNQRQEKTAGANRFVITIPKADAPIEKRRRIDLAIGQETRYWPDWRWVESLASSITRGLVVVTGDWGAPPHNRLGKLTSRALGTARERHGGRMDTHHTYIKLDWRRNRRATISFLLRDFGGRQGLRIQRDTLQVF